MESYGGLNFLKFLKSCSCPLRTQFLVQFTHTASPKAFYSQNNALL